MKLTGKVAIVTGAASGLGRAIAEKFLSEGARVAIADIRGAAEAAASLGPNALGVPMDVTDEKQVDEGIARVVEKFSGVDVLVSNAGVQIISPLVDLKFSDWKRMLAIHLDAKDSQLGIANIQCMVQRREGNAGVKPAERGDGLHRA